MRYHINLFKTPASWGLGQESLIFFYYKYKVILQCFAGVAWMSKKKKRREQVVNGVQYD